MIKGDYEICKQFAVSPLNKISKQNYQIKLKNNVSFCPKTLNHLVQFHTISKRLTCKKTMQKLDLKFFKGLAKQ